MKYLGVVLNGHNFTAKCKTDALNIQYIKSIRKHLSVENAKQLAYSLVLSHLDYCNDIYYGVTDIVFLKAQRIQNWAAKVVLERGR